MTKTGGREGRDRVGGNCSDGMILGALGKKKGRKKQLAENCNVKMVTGEGPISGTKKKGSSKP